MKKIGNKTVNDIQAWTSIDNGQWTVDNENLEVKEDTGR
ncbi:hypothetical protein FHX64_001349 [Microbacter margulisiae]|uniref:Uncharacterized protein n=1 Tax=Microbacter margulisiae TaxID=1350067 RepID=A0A7W5DQM2_9PORP|nr:hypothetical protein [Microbacter margulisiae]